MSDLELFFGDAHEAAARVYARLSQEDRFRLSQRLRGELIGPGCRFAQTLSARIPFRDLGPTETLLGASPLADSLLAEAIVPDPCFWTTELPMLYRAKIGVDGEPAGALSFERWIGLRRLAVRARSLVFDTQRWVARGARVPRISLDCLASARHAGVAIFGSSPQDDICLEASWLGVPLVVDLSAEPADLLVEARRLGQWPAVFIIAFERSANVDARTRSAARNTLFAAQVRASELQQAPHWAQLLILDADEFGEQTGQIIADCRMPIIVHRRQPSTAAAIELATVRRDCDRLQYDLAPIGDFAGYFVG